MKQNSHQKESSQTESTARKWKRLTPYQLYLQRETPEKRAQRLLNQKIDKKRRRERETPEERVARLREEAAYMKRRRHNETPEKRERRLLQRKKRYQETRAQKKAVTADRNTGNFTCESEDKSNLFGRDIVKQEDAEPKSQSEDIVAMKNSKWLIKVDTERRNVHNKENIIAPVFSTGPQTRKSKSSKPNIDNSITGASVDGNEYQFVRGTSNRRPCTISTDAVMASKEPSSKPIGSSIENSALMSLIVEAAWKQDNRQRPYPIHGKLARTSSLDFSKVLGMVAWRKYANYLNKMNSSSNQARL